MIWIQIENRCCARMIVTQNPMKLFHGHFH